jgi:hypothetical protein
VINQILVVGAFIFYLKGRDEHERVARSQHSQQVEQLVQRIQAPDVATAMHARTVIAPAPSVGIGIEDDKGYWDEVERLKDMAREYKVSANG